MVTTDVSARGVDYPGTRLVLQIGVPKSSEQYTHRVGRTGRAGRAGEGVLLLSPLELPFVHSLKDTQGLNLDPSTEFPPELVSEIKNLLKSGEDPSEEGSLQSQPESHEGLTTSNQHLIHETNNFHRKFSYLKDSIDPIDVEDMYVSLLGFYQSLQDILRYNSSDLIDDVANSLKPFGITDKPRLPSSLYQMLGLGSSNNRRPRSKSFGDRGSYNNRRPFNNRGDNDHYREGNKNNYFKNDGFRGDSRNRDFDNSGPSYGQRNSNRDFKHKSLDNVYSNYGKKSFNRGNRSRDFDNSHSQYDQGSFKREFRPREFNNSGSNNTREDSNKTWGSQDNS
jgi:ATP-dependent RNA helicase MSS116